ncbi:MAG: hypothetical protein JWO38_5217 [Gemmataceae bacterium]|nr:hypothetical protein [Gemmataceae bacterium]
MSMMPPVLTLAIPYYRGRKYIPRAIESVLGQDDGRWRLVVCDGSEGPPGDVRDLAEGYRDGRISYLARAGRPGIADNWNRGIAAAPTDLVALLHEDDELLPGYVGRMIAAADRYPEAAVLFCNARIVGPRGEPRFSFPDYVKGFFRPTRGGVAHVRGEAGLRAILRGNFIMCPTMCFRKSRLGARRFSARWRQVLDLDLTSRLLLAGERLVGIPDVLYAYRRHEGNTTAEQTRTLLRFHEERDLFETVARKAAEAGWPRAAAVARRVVIVKLNLAYCALRDVLGWRWREAGDKLRLLHQMLA